MKKNNSVDIVPIRAFKDNYIWSITNPNRKTCWVVDPGDTIPVVKYLKENQLLLGGILLTHHHADHSAGIKNLIKHYGNIPVVASHQSRIEKITQRVKEEDEINSEYVDFKVLEIPGHTLDHIAFYNKDVLFCGDTLFSAGCGKVFEGTPEQMYQSLMKLNKLPDETRIYCGHEYTLQNLMFAEHVEPENKNIKKRLDEVKSMLEKSLPTLPTTLEEERKYNPFLRCTDPLVIQAVESYAKTNLASPIEVFSQLRHWKNEYR